MTDKELRILDEMLTNLEIWSTWNKTFANEMIGVCSKMRNLLTDCKTESQTCNNCNFERCETCVTEIGKTESQLTAKCLNCVNSGSYKCSKCDGEMYFKNESQTERHLPDYSYEADLGRRIMEQMKGANK